jgi:hypothetical protein
MNISHRFFSIVSTALAFGLIIPSAQAIRQEEL